jgi:kynurenine formamidase
MTDITLCVTPKVRESLGQNQWKAFTGHLGTHFDVMDKVFPIEYAEREGIIFDVSRVGDGEVEISDIDLTLVKEGMAVIFATGFIEKIGYGNPTYFKEHPTLSPELIDALLLRHISIIGVDCAGVRRGAEHPPMDQHCADHDVFIVENLCHLGDVLQGRPSVRCHVHTYPMNFTGMTGLPCRVAVD